MKNTIFILFLFLSSKIIAQVPSQSELEQMTSDNWQSGVKLLNEIVAMPNDAVYPEQIEAAKALWKAIHEGVGIPLECPLDGNGNTSTTTDKKVQAGTFKGFVSHYHVSKRKIDCAGLDLPTLLEELKD